MNNLKFILILALVAIVSCAFIQKPTIHPIPQFLPTATPEKRFLELGEPVKFPKDLTELWLFVENGENGWVFDKCREGEITEPYITWEQSEDLFTNTSAQAERDAYGLLILLFFDHQDGKFTLGVCGDEAGKPILYGEGARQFLMWYNDPEQYFDSDEYNQLLQRLGKGLNKLEEIFGD